MSRPKFPNIKINVVDQEGKIRNFVDILGACKIEMWNNDLGLDLQREFMAVAASRNNIGELLDVVGEWFSTNLDPFVEAEDQHSLSIGFTEDLWNENNEDTDECTGGDRDYCN